MEELIDLFGKNYVLDSLIQYLPQDTINEFVEDMRKLHDLDEY